MSNLKRNGCFGREGLVNVSDPVFELRLRRQGNTTVTGIASDSSYQFTGRENDGDGLDYYRTRYYNPVWGMFISEDRIGFDGGGRRSVPLCRR
jgi:RHS repeat-associated protein